LQYFRKWNRDLLDALIDAFPVKPEPVQEEVVCLVLQWDVLMLGNLVLSMLYW
jgi:hypothetical protein